MPVLRRPSNLPERMKYDEPGLMVLAFVVLVVAWGLLSQC